MVCRTGRVGAWAFMAMSCMLVCISVAVLVLVKAEGSMGPGAPWLCCHQDARPRGSPWALLACDVCWKGSEGQCCTQAKNGNKELPEKCIRTDTEQCGVPPAYAHSFMLFHETIGSRAWQLCMPGISAGGCLRAWPSGSQPSSHLHPC